MRVGLWRGVTGWRCGAAPRSTLRSASADFQLAQGERHYAKEGITLTRLSEPTALALSRSAKGGL